MDVDSRVTELEIALAHQQRLVEELNGVVIEQEAAITKLSGEVQRLKEQVLQMLNAEEPPENVKPPHH